MFIEEIERSNSSYEIDLNSQEFQETEYKELVENVNRIKDVLPDLKNIDGVVFKRTKFIIDEYEEKLWKVRVSRGFRLQLVRAYHQDPMAGHGGIVKTLHRLNEKYYWPSMVVDVKSYITECEICRSSKILNVISRPPMRNQTPFERIFQRLYVDFSGPYPRSRQGNNYVFVVLDHHSKFVFLKPMRNAVAAEVVKYLENDIFHVVGIPEVIVSDNGRQFISATFSDLLNKYGVKHMRTAVYAPQANSSERVNRSMLAITRMEWTKKLGTLMSPRRLLLCGAHFMRQLGCNHIVQSLETL